MKCLYCKTEFANMRITAKYCSPKCRVYFNRAKVRVTKEKDKSIYKNEVSGKNL